MMVFLVILLAFDHSHWNGIDEEKDQTMSNKFMNRFYFLSTTFSTAGYGDITPKTNLTKMIVIVIQLFVTIGIFEIFYTAAINKD
jgi:hypothetical protein